MMHIPIKTKATCMLICLTIFQSKGQILNIEGLRLITDTTGWAGHLGAAISASKNTKSFFTFNTNGHIQMKTTNDLYLLVSNIEIVNIDGTSFNKSGFTHFRYNRRLSSLVKWEAFTQVQFNALTKIQHRWLNGVGIRLKLSPYERAKFYFGIAYMYEREKISYRDVVDQANRISTYFTFTLAPEAVVSLSNTTYLQPMIGNSRDFRVSNDVNLSFKINKHLSLSTIVHYLYDSRPPLDVPTGNYQISNGLTFKF